MPSRTGGIHLEPENLNSGVVGGFPADPPPLRSRKRTMGLKRLVWRETDLSFGQHSEFDLLREPKRVIYFNAKIPNRGLDFCVSEQGLYRP